MNKQLRLQNIIPAILISMTACGSIVASSGVFAQEDDATSTAKQKLYLDAIAASSAKDYGTAIEKYRAYLKLDPENGDVKAELEAAEKALLEAQAPVNTATPKNAFEQIVKQHKAIFAEADRAIREAEMLSARGHPARALSLLSEIDSALPKSAAAQVYRNRIALARQAANIVLDKQTDQDALAENLTEEAAESMRSRVLLARRAYDRAKSELGNQDLPKAIKSLDEAKSVLPAAISTRNLSRDIDILRAQVYAEYFYIYVEKRSPAEAEYYMRMVKELLGEEHKIHQQLATFYKQWRSTAAAQNPATLNPTFIKTEAEVADLLVKAKAQYLYGDFHSALKNYQTVLAYNSDNAEAKAQQIRIREILANSGKYNREVMRSMMFSAIDEKWVPAKQYTPEKPVGERDEVAENPIEKKMSRINISVSFNGAPLSRAVETLNELSQTYDPVGKGINFVLIDKDNKNPPVSFSMKDSPISQVLDVMLRQTNYSFEIRNDIVEITPSLGATDLEYVWIPMPQTAVDRIRGGSKRRGAGGGSDAFGAGGEEAAQDTDDETIIKNYLAKSGIVWDPTSGRDLSYADGKIGVNQDRRSIDRIRAIVLQLTDYEQKQVNIETKFIEVNARSLNQVVANWQMGKRLGETDEVIRTETNNRNVGKAHGKVDETRYTEIEAPPETLVTITGNTINSVPVPGTGISKKTPQFAPNLPSDINVGAGTANIFEGVVGSIGSYDVRLLLDALNQQDGTDLMAAPSLTTLSGSEATIKIVQLLRWPQNYDDMQINTGGGNGNNNNNNNNYGYNGGSVAITPGTPQFEDDATEVGIIMTLNPTVENNTIKLENMNPQIIEFEGFVDYGGNAVAISGGGTVVTTPSGFYQPVFNVRSVSTTVELYDGATLVIGGLTREEVRTVNDKVPILGDLPLIGSAFRSTGKAIVKKNLLIFVTANIMSRGGGTETSSFRGARPGEMYSDPTLFTSAGLQYREMPVKLEAADAPKSDATTTK